MSVRRQLVDEEAEGTQSLRFQVKDKEVDLSPEDILLQQTQDR